MKKALLLGMLLASGSQLSAMAPLTQTQLDNFRICVSKNSEGGFSQSFACSLEYRDASDPSVLTIQNFNGTGFALPINVDWENESVTIVPSAFGSYFDPSDYVMMMDMVISDNLGDNINPMSQEVQDSRVYGTISEDCITFENWNIGRCDINFTNMKKVYGSAQNSTIHIPNTSIAWTQLDWDDEWEDLIPMYEMEYGIWSEMDGDCLTVYNWNDLSSIVRLYKQDKDGVISYATDPDDVVCKMGKYDCGLFPLHELTWDGVMDVEPEPLVSLPMINANELEFGAWTIYCSFMFDGVNYGADAKLVFDFDIMNPAVRINSTKIGSKEDVRYYNLQGMEVDKPQAGLYIKVETDSNGIRKSTKITL